MGKRISVYLSEAEHDLVTQRAVRAGMKTPAYLRRIASGVLPEPKTKDFVTHGLAYVANELDAAADQAEEQTSKRAMLAARDCLIDLLKQHLGADGGREEP